VGVYTGEFFLRCLFVFSFLLVYGAWSTSDGVFLFVSRAKREAWVFTATSYYITSNRLGLHGGSKPREHWDIGVSFLYASRA